MNVNFEMALANNLDVKDLTLLSYLDLKSEEKNSDEFELLYSQIIEDLPLIFNSKNYASNTVKIRRMLEKEGMKNFVHRDIFKRGNKYGTVTFFRLNKENIKKLNVKGIVS